jgi:chloramphenicol-sensitive protein RarD
MLALSGLLIGFNWGLYIWAVNAGHVVESSLGYFINPLLNVLLGVVFLRERLGRMQWVSVAIATLGVAWLTLRFGQLPWIALALAASFALYGFIRKLASVESIPGWALKARTCSCRWLRGSRGLNCTGRAASSLRNPTAVTAH